MTTSIKLHTNGNYVSELRKEGEETVLGSAGPGSNVESDWINFPHGYTAIVKERSATQEEIDAAKKAEAEKQGTGAAGEQAE